eukprot:CAMPEP_0117765180 /NCGR_PEP_ID=MMETSP0947-20121206/19936_1 /TAXON_ID=44440 /ORGANISM="Chattonella subsalsa, Strain CCMP2191" /LENGTH=407 /DNA_ID=CAMNT_0005587741 /DNA_START=71 /DNA_END=1294 /DNA_ORIENTATION=-
MSHFTNSDAQNGEIDARSMEKLNVDFAQTVNADDTEVRDVEIYMKSDKDKATDFANYFCSYAFLYHQKQMLTDHRRMEAYHSAVTDNASVFQGKVVLDVGTGSGVLAVWSAQAGARKVYAVEYTEMAKHAQHLVKANGVEDVVEVLQSSVEELDLPEKVDIIISEWMGYFLLRESMLDSVLKARDKFLNPGGYMFPSHATMYWAPITNERERLSRQQEYCTTMQDWFSFKEETNNKYNLNMECLEHQFEQEQRHYYVTTSGWSELWPETVVGTPFVVKEIDLLTCTQPEIAGVDEIPFECPIVTSGPCRVSGFAGWFTTDFKGNCTSMLPTPVVLSTAPDNGYTHWGQQAFYLHLPLDCLPGDIVKGTFKMVRQRDNIRLYNIHLKHTVKRSNGAEEPLVYNKYEMP